MRAKLYFHHKQIYSDNAIAETKVWRVPKTWKTPEGFKYSLVYINKEGKRVLGYDNAEGKGHHCHKGKRTVPYEFQAIWKLIEIFLKEVGKIRRKTI